MLLDRITIAGKTPKERNIEYTLLGRLFGIGLSTCIVVAFGAYEKFLGINTSRYLSGTTYVLMIALFSLSYVVGPVIGRIVLSLKKKKC